MKIKEIITERVGPHAYKEVILLLDGSKPAAIIHSNNDMKHLMPYVRSGQLVRIKSALTGWIVAQKNEAWRLKEIYKLVNMIKEMHMEDKGIPISMSEYHTRLGELLGYSQADIDFFVKKQQDKGQW